LKLLTIIKRMINKNLFLLTLGIAILILQTQNCLANIMGVYGGWDDREQYYEIENDSRLSKSDIPYYKELATGVCLITSKSQIAVSADGKSKMYLSNTLYNKILEDYDDTAKLKKVCDSTKYKDEYVVNPAATGTLINDNSILTAHHVVADMIFSGPVVCIFNYFKSNKSDFQVNFENPSSKTKPYVLVNTSDVYDVTNTNVQLIKGNATPPYDFAVLTLSKNAAAKQKRMCFYSYRDILSQLGVYNKEIFSWGFPKGLPMKFVDDAHLIRSDSFWVDMDLYRGNSGSPIFVKINSGNFASWKYKIVGVVSRGEFDYDTVKAPVNGVNCKCWTDNVIDSGAPTRHETVSFTDQIAWVSGVSDTSCSIQWQKPPDVPPSPAKQKTRGEKPVINFKADKAGTFIIRLYYYLGGKEIASTNKGGCLKGNSYNVTMDWMPANQHYTYKIFNPDGNELANYGGSSISKATVLGSLSKQNLSSNTLAMAYIGNAPEYPYKTLQEAINNAPSGYTLHLARGEYNETVTITKPLTIIGDYDGSAMITSNGTSPAITIQSNNVSIENVYFQNSGFSGVAVALSNVTGCAIKNSFFSGYTPAIVLKNGCTGDTVTGNFLWGASTQYGIEINASTGNTLTNNVIDFGWDIFNFIGCTPAANTVSGNSITTKIPENSPPTAPGKPSANVINEWQINLSWTASADNIGVTQYKVEMKVGPTGTYATIGNLDGATTWISATGLKACTQYYFRVTAFDAAGNSTVGPETNVYTPESVIPAVMSIINNLLLKKKN
jgi:V8-like Glu-specific endopeptidase